VTQIVLAWIASQGMIALPGTVRADRFVENWASREVELTEEDLQEMRSLMDTLKPKGDRYNEEGAKEVGN